MTVRADDIALCRFREDLFAILECSSAGTERERLRRLIAMIEIHLVRREPAPAVRAWYGTKLAQELGRGDLPPSDALDFSFAICGVVRDVSRTLISVRRHA